MADLRARGRLVRVHAHLCLRESNEPIALADDHPQLAEVAALGELARALAALSCGADGFRVDELPLLAAATGHSTAECGQVADRLVRAGVLDNDRAGFLRCRSRALGNAVTRQLGKDEIQRFHRSIAEQLLDAGDLSTRFTAALASHVAEAGSSMAPRPELAELLSDTVCTALDPSQRAVYLYAAWWHSEAGVARTSLCSQLVRLLVRCAGYARLAEFVAEVVADERSGSALSSDARAELATAAALAAIHCGRPLSEPVRTALTCSEGVPDPIGFCDRWFGEEAIDWCDISSAFAPVWLGKGSSSSAMGRRRHRQGDVTVEMAFAVRNLVPVFEAVLGPDYQVPDDGPVAAYHRVCHGYAQGEWSAALSAARELRLVNADPESRHRASLLAAEMCGWRGEDRQASEWLASVPEDAFPVLRGWAASGLRYHDGDLTGAIEQGWEAYRREGREGAAPGSSRLLRRLAGIAMEAGQSYWSRRLLAEVEVRHDRLNTAESFETVSYVRSLIGVPGASPHDSERTVRLRGNRFELALACQVMGSTSDRPHSWLREAYDVALGVGASRLIARTKRALEECGGAVPSTRVRQDHLTENDLRIIALIRMGKTNRQIALELRTSEKSVARYLTRLYVKAGCRTRHGLATSGLGSSLEQVGA
ncbi:helix-turn-helix transcriptional regulator [Amycolatopsis sp. EV170708-02-1]|uniref:helix-turn-helix transcriptional regulator n=1 Tax=Amycolatopsis sp. EV170708-02-1 TaxID=2919322 RepID=UPI001F0B7C0C|nr:helix-turn-helix transcriptional regulator [Amycolatopsis sp. EV170708-02-1]UMP06929.1 helix-turn-helix transcriptional regulator [Amycolatopsis sp. EV170708-02-1]